MPDAPKVYSNALSNEIQAAGKLITDPVRNFKFLVTFSPTNGAATGWKGGFGTMGFVSLSGLSVNTEAIAYREGGYNTNMHQIPGQSSFTPISLSKGVMLNQNGNSLWMKRLFAIMTPSATSGIGSNFRCDLDIKVLSHPNPAGWKGSDSTAPDAANAYEQHASLRFKVYNAWITALSYSDLDAGANSLMVESMQLVHEGFDVSYAEDLTIAKTAAALP
jgi:phage tail-like protein